VGNHFKHARHLAGKGEKQKMILFSFFPCFHFFLALIFIFYLEESEQVSKLRDKKTLSYRSFE
jgi:hypothetical protein